MDPPQVGDALVAGLAAYGVAATFEVEEQPQGRWLLTLDFEPDGAWCEGTRGHPTFRMLEPLRDDVTVGQALDACVVEAGAVLRQPRPEGRVRRLRRAIEGG